VDALFYISEEDNLIDSLPQKWFVKSAFEVIIGLVHNLDKTLRLKHLQHLVQ
jgi:hypothetical protein